MGRQQVLIVGGAKGVGEATVQLLAAEGRDLIVVDRDQAALQQLGERVSRHVLDITDRAAVKRLFGQLQAEGASLRSLVICAGVHSTYPVEYIPDEVIDQVIEVNFAAHVRLVREALPLIEDGGSIIAVSSIAATVGIPMSSMYSASKAALELFYESLATEISYRKIRPVIVQAGNVNTGFNETGNLYEATGNKPVDEGYRRVVSRMESSKGMPAMAVAKVIRKAVDSPKPRLCYIVGANALKAFWARRLLGRSTAVRLLARHFGFKP